MKQYFKIPIIGGVGLVFFIFAVLRLTSALPVMMNMKKSLWDMVWTNRNDNYQTRIERFWYEDYRYSKLILKIVKKDKTVFLKDIVSNEIHPMIMKNFLYPINVSSDPFDRKVNYYGFYPGVSFDNSLNCNNVFLFNLENENMVRIDCVEYFRNSENFINLYGLIEIQ